jgi:dynein intermediate chain 4, axonemal
VERGDSQETNDIESTIRHIKDERSNHPSAKNPSMFVKFLLTETDDVTIYECPSLTEVKGSEEGNAVEKYNADYEYLTVGAGKNRRKNDAEVQTQNILIKSRSVSTDKIKKDEKGSFVSNFEMFDTYADIARLTKELEIDDDSHRKIEVTTYVYEGMEKIEDSLSKNENFHLSSMVLQRLLAANVYRERQKRFRNMIMPNPLDLNVKYLYRLELMWSYRSAETQRCEVVDMSWCHQNSDLLAVAYGNYYYRESRERNFGAVLIWSIKNPVNPERRYRFNKPVTSVEFSQKNPQLLAIATYDGIVRVVDITENCTGNNYSIVAMTERKSSPVFEPIWQIQWIQVKDEEFILSASQDGRIQKLKISTGPYLVGYPQMRLDRVEGTVEAFSVEHKKSFIEADRHPHALTLQKHPATQETYFVGTDEGCVHICSMNFPHQHLGVLQLHTGSIYAIDFSPFSPKIFLTAGSDWVVRIWIENIFEPVMELSDGFEAIHSAYWSPIHSTVIASCTENSVQIWDLRRKNLKPASIRKFEGKNITVIKFSTCGRSIIVGDTDGNCHVCSLEDFPFPPYYQYDELQRALYHSLTNKQDLEKQIKQLGYLGYPQEQQKTSI